MKCCPNCFGDHGLAKEIRFRSTETGTCKSCGSANVDLLEARTLADKFEPLLNAYEPDENGRLLTQWLREDWFLFTHESMDDARAQVLLADIYDDGQLVRIPYVPSKQFDTGRLDRWEELREELLHENRFFPDTQIDFERLEALLVKLVLPVEDLPTVWYRARVLSGGKLYEASEMNAPPSDLASHGRANPAGIPYLYLGSEIVTSISEIRPHTGESVCVANFTIPEATVALIDLRNPRKTVSPFVLDGDDIGEMRYDLGFLERLGDELTRPVRRQAAAFDYTPSQYLCEFIKKCGYDGVVYRSSVSDGINLALFDPSQATIGEIKQYDVEKVTVSAHSVE